MKVVAQKPRLVAVSPFLDKRHGTERRVVEWISRLADDFEIHVYSQRIEDLDLSKITWHRVPKMPGPHLVNFVWWFAANQFARQWNRRIHGVQHDIVFSPGVNCLDADVVSVHVVFAEYVRRNRAGLAFTRRRVWSWPRLLHRKVYYSLIVALERCLYTRRDLTLVLIARRTRNELARFYGRRDALPPVYLGLDHAVFNRSRLVAMRQSARNDLKIPEGEFVLLLIGNDWRNKGVPVILEAMTKLRDLRVRLLIVSREKIADCRALIERHNLTNRVFVSAPRSDVGFFYAATDAYVGPSLEDTFAQPPAEAMACGLPVIVSSTNGTSEIITDGEDGLILADPTDANTLAVMIRRLYEDREFRERLGVNAAETARQYTWERNGRELADIFREIIRRKDHPVAQSVASEL